MSSLEERVKSLEEWRDAVSQACFMAPKKSEPTPAPKQEPLNDLSATELAQEFPEDLRQHLTIKGGKIYNEYVSTDKFIAINDIAKSLGYERISAGKDSHWRKV